MDPPMDPPWTPVVTVTQCWRRTAGGLQTVQLRVAERLGEAHASIVDSAGAG